MSNKILKNVLLVDDDSINNYINERLLKKMNICENIKVLLNGEEAIKHIEQEIAQDNSYTPDLILLDINMPVMDGFEFMEAFKKLDLEKKEKVVIIMLTTSTNPGDMDRVKHSIASDFINKPLTEDKISGILNKYLQV
ncbi:response regulator [Cytophagaceae bacterium ABcell3]|nr:response regulator [Cytophagaceae bacterium ABcell3]